MSDLHTAARNGDKQALMLAIASGADLDPKDNLLRTPLILASWAGHLDFVRLLLASGCNANAAASDDMNALHFAAQKGHTEVIKQLLNTGKVNVNGRTRKGATPLLLAAQNGHLEIVELLLRKKANPLATNSKGQNAVQLAKGEEVKAALQAAIDALPSRGQTHGNQQGDNKVAAGNNLSSREAHAQRQQQRARKRQQPGDGDVAGEHFGEQQQQPTQEHAPDTQATGEARPQEAGTREEDGARNKTASKQKQPEQTEQVDRGNIAQTAGDATSGANEQAQDEKGEVAVPPSKKQKPILSFEEEEEQT